MSESGAVFNTFPQHRSNCHQLSFSQHKLRLVQFLPAIEQSNCKPPEGSAAWRKPLLNCILPLHHGDFTPHGLQPFLLLDQVR